MSAPSPLDRVTARETLTAIAVTVTGDTLFFLSEMDLQSWIQNSSYPLPATFEQIFDLDRSTGKWVAR